MSVKTFLAMIFLALSVSSFAENNKSKAMVEEAWKAWQKNDHELVKADFLNAIKEDPENTHAYWGLTLLYSLEDKQQEAWNTFRKVIELEPDYYPYVYSLMYSNMMTAKELANPEIVEFYKKLTEKPDGNGTLRAMAAEKLGKYYIAKGDFRESEKYFLDMNAIEQWMLIGPFDNISASGYDKVFPPETEFSPDKTYPGQNGIPAKWLKQPMARRDRWIDYTRFYSQRNAAFYANTFVFSPKKQTVQLRIGTSGFLRAYLNDQLIIDVFDEYNNDLDTYISQVDLQEGWNRLLIKCGYAEISACNFLARITDQQGNKINDLKYSAEQQTYDRTGQVNARMVVNSAEEYFRQKIKTDPAQPENYYLLAEAYLRNDKSVEAELVLKDAIKQFPDCMLFYYKITEAYLRGKKNDEMETAFEKIISEDKNIPDVLSYKIMSYIKNEEYDKAEEMIKILEKIAPDSQSLFDVSFELYTKKTQWEKILDLTAKACEKYPYEYKYAYMNALISYQKTKSYAEAIKVLEDFQKKNYSDVVLYSLAQFYLQSGDIANWERYMDKLLEYEPVSPGHYYTKSNVFYSMHEYGKAEEVIKKALELSSYSAALWSRLGEIYRMKGENSRAIEMLNTSLVYDATNYDVREMLRELQGKKSLYQQFESEDINTLVKNSPSHEMYPGDNGVVLLNDMKRLVYKKGASESTEELLVKVFNKNGIDAYKEYWINYGSNQQLIVEKAVVIKKDGSEVKADVDENHIVFKSLEENDCIYIKHRLKNAYAGKLSKYYWDTFNFSGYYPMKKVSYSLFLEDDTGFKYQTQNMSEKPAVKKTEDGTFYSWVLKDQAAIEQEYGMPPLNDIGKTLSISNLPEWNILVDWYSDLTKNKARSNYEIKEQVNKLFEGKSNLTEDQKIQVIYDFITENIRYSSVAFRQSDLIPQKARDVLASRIGDCKDMATLCKAMLNEAGINSYYVLVNTTDDGMTYNALPSVLFNHCILAVETQKGEKFLDLTANNVPVNSLPLMDIGALYLLIKPGVAAPSRIPKNGYQQNVSSRYTTVTFNPNGNLKVKTAVKRSGLLGATFRESYRYIDSVESKKNMSESLSQTFSNLKMLEFNLKNLNDFESPAEYDYTFEAPNLISETGNFTILKMPWIDDLRSDYGFSYEKRKFPYYRATTVDSLTEEINIVLPEGYEPLDANVNVSHSSSFADYTISTNFQNGVIHTKRSVFYKNPVISAEDYLKCKEFYNKALKEDSKQILLKKKM